MFRCINKMARIVHEGDTDDNGYDGGFDYRTLDESDFDGYDCEDLIKFSHNIPAYSAKPKWLVIDNIKRKFKWHQKNGVAEEDKNLQHRRFSVTVQVPSLIKAFKQSVKKNEIEKDDLLTVFRVTTQKLLQNPELSDVDLISMYSMLRKRVNETYERRLKERRKVK